MHFIRQYNYVDIYLNNLYWRNTRESIKNEYEIPPVVQDLVLLDLDPIERAAYKNMSLSNAQGVCAFCLLLIFYSNLSLSLSPLSLPLLLCFLFVSFLTRDTMRAVGTCTIGVQVRVSLKCVPLII